MVVQGERSRVRRVSGIVASVVGWLLFIWCALVVATLVAEVISDEFVGESVVGYIILMGVPALVGWWLLRWGKRQRRWRSAPPVTVEETSRSRASRPNSYSSTARKRTDTSQWVPAKGEQSVESDVEKPEPNPADRPMSSEEMLEQAKKRTNRS